MLWIDQRFIEIEEDKQELEELVPELLNGPWTEDKDSYTDKEYTDAALRIMFRPLMCPELEDLDW